MAGSSSGAWSSGWSQERDWSQERGWDKDSGWSKTSGWSKDSGWTNDSGRNKKSGDWANAYVPWEPKVEDAGSPFDLDRTEGDSCEAGAAPASAGNPSPPTAWVGAAPSAPPWTGRIQSPSTDPTAVPPWIPQSRAVAAALDAIEETKAAIAKAELAEQQRAQQLEAQQKAERFEEVKKMWKGWREKHEKHNAPTSAPASAGEWCDASHLPPDRNRVRSLAGYEKARARDQARAEAYKQRKGKGKGKNMHKGTRDEPYKPEAPAMQGKGKGTRDEPCTPEAPAEPSSKDEPCTPDAPAAPSSKDVPEAPATQVKQEECASGDPTSPESKTDSSGEDVPDAPATHVKQEECPRDEHAGSATKAWDDADWGTVSESSNDDWD